MQSVTKVTPTDITAVSWIPGHSDKSVTHFKHDWSTFTTEEDGQIVKYQPPEVKVPMPVRPGDSWHIDYATSNNKVHAKSVCGGEGKAIGFEAIAVPTGSFNALKIERSVNCQVTGDSMYRKKQFHEFEWYASAAMNTVKMTQEVNFETYGGSMSVDFVVELASYKVKGP